MDPNGRVSGELVRRLRDAAALLPAKKVRAAAEDNESDDEEEELDVEGLVEDLNAVFAAADEPYGDVDYADPGYQDDGKKRYPLDTEEHCRAAWSYINQADNAAKYSPDELSRIKSKIRAALKRYGAAVTAAKDLPNIELARPGTWKLASGPLEVTPQHLDDAARFANRDGARPGYLKIGHTDTRFMAGDGEPALGWLHNLRVEDDDGPVLKGDLKDVPDWLAEAMPRHWPDRSIEGYQDYTHDGEVYSLVVDGLALLGVTPPGMASIRSLRDLPAALGVAASLEPSGRRIVASLATTQTSAPSAEEPIKKGAGMSLAKYREALAGLPDDASEDDVKAALTGAGFAVPEPQPVAASAQPGTIVLASSVWDETQKTIKTLTNFVEKTKRDERDDVIAKAVIAGKFTPAQKQHFSRLWDADPDGTRNLIDNLMPNSALAVMASGYAGEADDLDNEYAALYGEIRKVG